MQYLVATPRAEANFQSSFVVKMFFGVKLNKMLTNLAEKGQEDIVSWGPGGASFLIHDTQRLVSEALPAYFDQTKYKSFRKQLSFYGFARILGGPLEGSYWHPPRSAEDKSKCAAIFLARITTKPTTSLLYPE